MGLNFHVCLNFIMIIPLGASSFFEYYYITYIYIAMIDLLISTFPLKQSRLPEFSASLYCFVTAV